MSSFPVTLFSKTFSRHPASADAVARPAPMLRRRLGSVLAHAWQRLCLQAERKTRFVPYF